MLVKSIAIMEMNHKFKPALQGAVKESLKETGMIFRDVVKQMTIDENHVVTGRYLRSIGNMTSLDGIFRFTPDGKALDVGTNVFYSTILEGRYSMLARGIDMAAPKTEAKIGVVFTKYLNSHS